MLDTTQTQECTRAPLPTRFHEFAQGVGVEFRRLDKMVRRIFTLAFVAAGLAGCASDFDPGPLSRRPPGVLPRVVHAQAPLQCVPYARWKSGVTIWGDAWHWWEKASGKFGRSSEPERGSVLVLKGFEENGRGHVAVVRKIINSREIVVDHANWLNGGEINLDSPVMDVSDDNDWSRVRVWYTPGDHYGGRVYDVQGFILGAG
jgi:CHAP domain